ncbi:MAG: MBL fold metallo-hydrolase [Sphingobium sp.]
MIPGPIRVGAASIRAIVEQESVSFGIDSLLGSVDPALIEANRDWLVPDHLDPVTGMAHLSHHAWLVETGRYRILVDPCVGNGRDRPIIPPYHQLDTPWIERLEAAGVTPEQIDFVLCTHLHVDHCGWNTRLVDGRYVPTFPNARYIFTRAEQDFWSRELTEELPRRYAFNRGIYAECVQPVIDAGLAWVVEGDESFADLFTLIPCPGHTQGHVAGLLDGGTDGALFVGDVLHSPLQVIDPTINGLGNADAAMAVESRCAMLQLASDRNLLLAPGHFRGSRACRVSPTRGGFAIEWLSK